MNAITVTRAQANAFRLEAQHLAQRLPLDAFFQVFSAGPFQNTPPGAAELSLQARVAGLAPGAVDRRLVEEKSLLQTWSLRASPHIFPTSEASVYTHGLLPQSEVELAAFILGIQPALEICGMTAKQVVDWTVAAIREVLDGQVISGKQNLDRALAAWVAPRLTDPTHAGTWAQPSLYAADQTLGEAMVSFALRPAALLGWICLAGPAAAFTRTDQWLGVSSPTEPDASLMQSNAAALLRRYLGSLGPSTREHFAVWAGVDPRQAARVWEAVAAELREVRLEGRPAWILERDLPRLEAQHPAQGAILLPPHDPYLQMRDRSSLIQEKDTQRALWRTVGSPGLVLLHGIPVGLWRARKQPGKRTPPPLLVTVQPLVELSVADQAQIEAEAQRLAPFKGCSSTAVVYNNDPI